jgi:hypothetical protein
MHPPAGRIGVGARVTASGNRHGEVVSERSIASNGAWAYVVRFADGSTRELYDFELRIASAG